MANDFEQLSSAFAARIRELGVGPADPRVAPLVAQLHQTTGFLRATGCRWLSDA